MLGPLLLAGAPAPFARSGDYGPLTLAVAGDVVTGVFSEARIGNGSEAAPQFTCIFLLRGRLRDGAAAIATWYPGEAERIAGVLRFEANGVAFRLGRAHGGCDMTSGDMVREPYRLTRDAPGAGWQGVALVTARRAHLHGAPAANARRGAYLVDGDPIAVLERRSGWIRAAYTRGARRATGWLRAADVAVP